MGHSLLILLLTLLTQIGGLAWGVALLFKRPFWAFLSLYTLLSVSMVFIAPTFGRQHVSCFAQGPLQVASPLYCALNRTYVTPILYATLNDVAEKIAARHPGTITQMLDGSFPLFDGFPLLPHLSHADGRKADLAFFYRTTDGQSSARLRSPLGYFAFEEGPSSCPDRVLTLRWDLGALQRLWRDLELDLARMQSMIAILSADERIAKIFVEPHLKAPFGASHPKLRFQGCRAARHDDHLHIQL